MRALGLMSGTSMDGVDACLIETDGLCAGAVLDSRFFPFAAAERAVLEAARGRWPDEGGLAAAHQIIFERHVEAIGTFSGVDVVGFHGQTLAHAPDRGRTHQLGDGAALAAASAVPVVWDFRSADVAAGGQGAPLAPFYHHALVRSAGLDGTIAVLNLGGVANVTCVRSAEADPSRACLAFDTGPGCGLIDRFMTQRTGAAFDTGGALAAAGRADTDLIRRAMKDPFFAAPPPKSLDRETFADVLDAVAALSDADGAATLTALTAECVAASCPHMPHPAKRWLVCGGGRHNPALMTSLTERLDAEVDPVEALGWDGDMLEAAAFGWLAVRVLKDLPLSAPQTTGAPCPLTGGRISRPAAP